MSETPLDTVRQPGDGPILGPGAKGDPLHPELRDVPEAPAEPAVSEEA